MNRTPQFHVGLAAIAIVASVTLPGQAETVAIPELNPKGDVYKTEGPNDPLIYGSTIGRKTAIMLYVDFLDAAMEIDTQERARKVLGDGKFQQLFKEQSYGNVSFEIRHINGWRRLSKSQKDYSSKTTEAHRELFVEIFSLYPKVDFLAYDYIMVNMPRIGNTAFGERDAIAIPYKGKKINVALNISSASPYVLAHETAHCMGLPDLYSYGGAKGMKNPTGPWDLMAAASKAGGFLGWHRHKLKWLDAKRKTYVVKGKHRFELTPLNAPSGVSMITVPVNDPANPSKVFVVEIAQPIRNLGKVGSVTGVLVYSVDATLATGLNAVVVYPKIDLLHASFEPGDLFEHKEAPLSVKVLKKNGNGSYLIELDVPS